MSKIIVKAGVITTEEATDYSVEVDKIKAAKKAGKETWRGKPISDALKLAMEKKQKGISWGMGKKKPK